MPKRTPSNSAAPSSLWWDKVINHHRAETSTTNRKRGVVLAKQSPEARGILRRITSARARHEHHHRAILGPRIRQLGLLVHKPCTMRSTGNRRGEEKSNYLLEILEAMPFTLNAASISSLVDPLRDGLSIAMRGKETRFH